MTRIARNFLLFRGVITGLMVLEFISVYSRHGLPGFKAFMQEAVYTHVSLALASAALT